MQVRSPRADPGTVGVSSSMRAAVIPLLAVRAPAPPATSGSPDRGVTARCDVEVDRGPSPPAGIHPRSAVDEQPR